MNKKVMVLFFGILLVLSLSIISAAPFWKKITGNSVEGGIKESFRV